MGSIKNNQAIGSKHCFLVEMVLFYCPPITQVSPSRQLPLFCADYCLTFSLIYRATLLEKCTFVFTHSLLFYRLIVLDVC